MEPEKISAGFGKDLLPVLYDKALIGREASKSWLVPLVVTSTKPDFYKQAPLFPSAAAAHLPVLGMNTGQHFDSVLGHGLDEFSIRENIAIDLQIRGGLSEKTAELFLKLSAVGKRLSTDFPKNKFLPIVHGDTHAAGMVPLAWMFSTNSLCAQNEAGLRAMQPSFKNWKNPREFLRDQRNRGGWSLNRTEPFPEQYDTFVGAAASFFHFAPLALNRENLEREGYVGNRIPVVGNSVVEALRSAEKALGKRDARHPSVFDAYPSLERGEWIRVDIHRRENLSPGRFRAILGGVETLVRKGKKVVFIEMNANKFAVDSLGLQGVIEKLKENPNFLYTPLWKEYSWVVEFLTSGKCSAVLTDSGSLQEELNELRGPVCLTCRFSTDRPESVFSSAGNFIVPPASGESLAGFVNEALSRAEAEGKAARKRLYGKTPSKKIMGFLKRISAGGERDFFEWANERVKIGYGKTRAREFFL